MDMAFPARKLLYIALPGTELSWVQRLDRATVFSVSHNAMNSGRPTWTEAMYRVLSEIPTTAVCHGYVRNAAWLGVDVETIGCGSRLASSRRIAHIWATTPEIMKCATMTP